MGAEARCPADRQGNSHLMPRLPDSGDGRGSVWVDAVPVGFELVQELAAAGLLVGLADRRRRLTKAGERPEEPAVGLVPPPHVARATPPRLAEPVEAPVVAHPEVRVRLDVVAASRPSWAQASRKRGQCATTVATSSRRAPTGAASAVASATRASLDSESSTVSGGPDGVRLTGAPEVEIGDDGVPDGEVLPTAGL